MALNDEKTILGDGGEDSPQTLAEGSVLGDYRIGKSLGSGAMGEVYEAEQVHLGRRYAVKVLPDSLSGDAQFAARFQQEARTLASLDHPNIVTVHNAGHASGHFFLVMEQLEPFRASSDPEVVSHILAQILKGLSYAHNKGIFHRDLKPSNLLQARMSQGQVVPTVKIADFGVARVVGDDYMKTLVQETIALSQRQAGGSQATGTGSSYVGTLKYMAPEVMEGQEADGRSDLYAVGVMAYEWLTGKRPVGRYKDATQIRPDLHPDWDGWLNMMLEADPEDRMEGADFAYHTLPGVANPILMSQAAASQPKPAAQPEASSDKEVLAAAFYALKEQGNVAVACDSLMYAGHGATQANEAIRRVRKALLGARFWGAVWVCGKILLWIAAIALVAVILDEGLFLWGLLAVALLNIVANLYTLLRIPFIKISAFQHPGELFVALRDYEVPAEFAVASSAPPSPPYARSDLPMMDENAQSRDAVFGGPWRRLFAAVTDVVIINVGLNVLAFGLILMVPGFMDESAPHPALFPLILGMGLLAILYFTVLESSAMQATLGKRLLGLKVTDRDGERISFLRALGRYFSKFISAILLLWGYLRILYHPQREGLHDTISGCQVRRR
ncbi:MAG: protein kinase [Opitutales bacterium]|nr:protein kinase [Opitutales bacterium]